MSLDRIENVELIDAPTSLVLSKLWTRQHDGLTNLIFKLDRDLIKAVREHNEKLGSLPKEKLMNLNKQYDFYVSSPIRYNFSDRNRSIWEDTNMNEWPSDLRFYLKFSTLRKAVVSFNRNANPEWNYEKAEKKLSEYNKLKEEVAGNRHIEMPEIQLPPKALAMPFITKANELIQTTMNEIYDFETKKFRQLPYTVAELTKRHPHYPEGGRKRKVLMSSEEDAVYDQRQLDEEPKSDWRLVGAEQMIDVTDLLHELRRIEEFYHAPSIYLSLMHHISHLENFNKMEDEDEEGDSRWESFP